MGCLFRQMVAADTKSRRKPDNQLNIFMPKGRPPKPKILNDLRGDPGKRRRNAVEPEAPEGMPVCPDHLDEIAKQEWKSVTAHLKSMGLLSTADRSAIEMYCISYSRYRRAVENCQKYGDVILSPNKQVPMISPYSTIQNQAFEQCRKLLIEFGLTPSARARMRITDEKKTDSKWDGFLKVVG